MKTASLIALIILIALFSIASADTTTVEIGWDGSHYYPANGGYQVGLALSGGGARGFAQIGILKAFEESGIIVSAIAGTSIGGIVGGLYAAGYSAEELEKITSEIDFFEFFTDRPSRTAMHLTQRPEKERYLISVRFDGLEPYIPRAITAGQKLSDFLSGLTLKANYFSEGNFKSLKIPFAAVTTDIVSGDKVVLTSGNLADAMRATMAFPLAFTGVDRDSMLLMDGGIVDPIPVSVTRNLGNNLDLIIGVNTASDLLSKDKISDPIDIANQVTSIMTMDKLKASIENADIIISPELRPYNNTDFEKTEEIIKIGYKAGLDAVARIREAFEFNRGTDSIYISEIEFQNVPDNFDTAGFQLQTGNITIRQNINELAGQLYRQLDLLYISINTIELNEKIDGKKSVRIEISMIPRPFLRKLKYAIRGNTVIEDSTIIKILKINGRDLTAEDIVSFNDSLRSIYNAKNYDLAHLRSLEFIPDHDSLIIVIDEAIVEKINITGNRKTKDWLIKSNFPLDEGKPFNSRLAARGIRNIYATDLFRRVVLNISKGQHGAIIHINTEEKKYVQLRAGWHWHNDYRSEQFLEILNDNLLGTGQTLLLHGQYGEGRQKYYAWLKADRFLSTYLTYKIHGFYNILERDIYDGDGNTDSWRREYRYGIEFVLGQQISRLGTVTGELRFEEIKDKYFPGSNTDITKLRKITLRSHVENINRIPFPTEGKRHIFYVQFAGDILGAEKQFTKFYSSVESYFPWGRLNFHPKIQIGYTDAKYGVPISERFYVGGHYSFFGYETDELVGAKMLLFNIGFRFKLPLNFYLTTRYDFGEVYNNVDHIKLKNLRHGWGLSLALDTPIGPIDLGWGKARDRDDNWYLDIGLRF